MNTIKIMFVCMGNICRSPTAHAILQHKVDQQGLSDRVQIASSGTHAYHIGDPPDSRSQALASQRGVDMSSLRAQKISINDYDDFDWILAMDQENLDLINYYAPESGSELGPDQQTPAQIALLMSFSEKYPDISEVPDPYYGGAQGFEHVFDIVDDACDGLIKQLLSRL